MTFLGLAFCLGILVFGTVSALFSMALRPMMRRAAAVPGPSSGTLFALRYAPTLTALLFTTLVFLPAFLFLEPRHSGERIGPLMLALAGAVVILLAAGPLRGLRSLLASQALVRRWRSGAVALPLPGSPVPAFAIDEEFPLVAVVGILRPRLYVARRVLRGCTGDEMAAILRHEGAHVLRRDNLKRFILCSCPDLLAFGSAAPGLERAWGRACDRAADDHAARRGSPLDLASALVKVARAIQGPAPVGAALSACCGGDEIATRVRRLLGAGAGDAGAPAGGRRLAILLVLLALAGLVAGQDAAVRRGVHGVTEDVVRLLQ